MRKGDLLSSYPPGKNLQVGSTVRICGLEGEQLNKTVARITGELKEEHYDVDLLQGGQNCGQETRIKPANLRIVCSSCWSDLKVLNQCGVCKTATYCNVDCQHTHWKKGGHKAECQHVKTKQACIWHPTWKMLTPKQVQDLREFHEKSKCTVPWPVTGVETPAMLSVAPCFLTNHPNMRFKVVRQNMPSGFIMQYNDPLSDVSGRIAPEGRALWLLKEDFSWGGQEQFDPKQYYSKVPIHSPTQVIYAVIAEVLWTEIDYLEMKAYYDGELGKYFDWPGVECVGICPGTGEKVPFSMTDKHLLVACNLQGSTMQGNSLVMTTRVMPRILTRAGYEKMMGPSGGPHRTILISKTLDGPKEPVPFYPDFFQETQRANPYFYGASRAYDQFHATGLYKAFERWLDDEKGKYMPGLPEFS